MGTTNPYEIERMRKRDAMVAETARLAALNHAEGTTAETIDAVIAERDTLRAQLIECDSRIETLIAERDAYEKDNANLRESCQSLTREVTVLQAEIMRLTHQPHEGST